MLTWTGRLKPGLVWSLEFGGWVSALLYMAITSLTYKIDSSSIFFPILQSLSISASLSSQHPCKVEDTLLSLFYNLGPKIWEKQVPCPGSHRRPMTVSPVSQTTTKTTKASKTQSPSPFANILLPNSAMQAPGGYFSPPEKASTFYR